MYPFRYKAFHEIAAELAERRKLPVPDERWVADWLTDSLRWLEQNARNNALHALLQGVPMLQRSYHTDPEFHAALDLIIQIAVLAVMDPGALTEEERRNRANSLGVVMRNLDVASLFPDSTESSPAPSSSPPPTSSPTPPFPSTSKEPVNP